MVNIVELVPVNPCLLQTLLAERGAAFAPCLYHFLDLPTVKQDFTLQPHSLSGYCCSNYLWASTCLTLSLCTIPLTCVCLVCSSLSFRLEFLVSAFHRGPTPLVTQSKVATSYPLSHHPYYLSNTFSFVCLSLCLPLTAMYVSKKDDLHGNCLPLCPQTQHSA